MHYSTLALWISPIRIEGVSDLFLLMSYFVEIPVFNANTINHDQTPLSVASDLGPHSLPMFFFGNIRH